MRAGRHLVGETFGGGRQRVGVGHLEDGGHSTHDGGAGAGLEIFLVGGAGFTEVYLTVDDAGQYGEAGAIDRLAGRSLGKIADLGDSAVAKADVALTDTVVVDDSSVSEDGVESHGGVVLCEWPKASRKTSYRSFHLFARLTPLTFPRSESAAARTPARSTIDRSAVPQRGRCTFSTNSLPVLGKSWREGWWPALLAVSKQQWLRPAPTREAGRSQSCHL